MSEHLYTFVDPPNERHLDRVRTVLQQGGVLALSTGTSWAFVADPASKKAIGRIRTLKPGHPKELPFSLLCGSISMATTMAVIDGDAFRLLNRIWPGPFTVLLKSKRSLPRLLQNKRTTVGIRIPDDPLVQALVERWGGPLMASTVPPSPQGQLLTMGYEVFEEHGHGLDLVLDLGEPVPGSETTVVAIKDGELEVVREGVGDLSLL